MMQLIVITPPRFLEREAEQIRLLLEAGIDRVHLRKPDSTQEQMRRLLEELPATLYPRITLQDHLPLATEYPVGGIHLNRRNHKAPEGFTGLKSRSCHSLQEIEEGRQSFDYQFLSPIFDSISKEGYTAHFTPQELAAAHESGTLGPRVVALGGMEPHLLQHVARLGFGGAAFLGYIWQDDDNRELRRRAETLIKIRKQLE